jgi:hypothetical protein
MSLKFLLQLLTGISDAVNGACHRVALVYVNSTLHRGKRMTLVRFTTSRVLCLICVAIVCSGPLWFSLAPSSSLVLALGIAIVLITWARRPRNAMNAATPRTAIHPSLRVTLNEAASAGMPAESRRHQRRAMMPIHRRPAARRNDGNPRRRTSSSGSQMLIENAPRIWPSTEPSSRYVH